MQLYMSERDGTDKIEDSPKKACSFWFTRGSRLATSGANLYILMLCCVVLFRFRFFAFIYINPLRSRSRLLKASLLREISSSITSRSSICIIHRQPSVDSFLDMSLFPSIMSHCRFLHGEYVVRFPYGWCVFFRGFNLVTTSSILTSAYYLRFEPINQSINLLPPTSGDINARGGSMSRSYVVKYTTNGDSQRPLRWKTHRPQSTGAEFIMAISIRLRFFKKRGKSPTP